MSDVYAGYPPNVPHVHFTLDLTVNGEELHVKQRFPLAVWDTLSPDQKAEITLASVLGAAREAVLRFADRIKVTRDDGKEP
jgi:hypothetical protein